MTLTYPAIDAARQILWLVTGAEKREPLAKLLAGDPSIPAGRVRERRDGRRRRRGRGRLAMGAAGGPEELGRETLGC